MLPSVQRTHGILEYLRFKDDIIVIAASSRSGHDEFFKQLFRRSGCYKLKFDSVSTYGVEMLDLFVSKSSGFGRTKKLDLSIYLKPTF